VLQLILYLSVEVCILLMYITNLHVYYSNFGSENSPCDSFDNDVQIRKVEEDKV